MKRRTLKQPSNKRFPFIENIVEWKFIKYVIIFIPVGFGLFSLYQWLSTASDSPIYEFETTHIGLMYPVKVRRINTIEKRRLVKEAIKRGEVRNEFNLNTIKQQGLFLCEYEGASSVFSKHQSRLYRNHGKSRNKPGDPLCMGFNTLQSTQEIAIH